MFTHWWSPRRRFCRYGVYGIITDAFKPNSAGQPSRPGSEGYTEWPDVRSVAGPQFRAQRQPLKRRTSRRWLPNIQTATIEIEGRVRKVSIAPLPADPQRDQGLAATSTGQSAAGPRAGRRSSGRASQRDLMRRMASATPSAPRWPTITSVRARLTIPRMVSSLTPHRPRWSTPRAALVQHPPQPSHALVRRGDHLWPPKPGLPS